MNTFWGCETEHLIELSTSFDTRAVQLRAVIQQAAVSVRATSWIGPDAEDYRLRTEDLVETVRKLVDRLRELGELLTHEAEEQEICSQPGAGRNQGADPLGVRATPPWVQGEGDRLPSLRSPRLKDPWPGNGVPFLGEDPTKIADRLPERPDFPSLEDVYPLIGGPFMAKEPSWPSRLPGPLPDGEGFGLDPALLAHAEEQRSLLFGLVPGVGFAQTAVGIHEVAGGVYDRIEHSLEENGYGAFTPLVSLARAPHDISDAVIGEKSVFGQVTSAFDRGLANVAQTGEEVFSEAVDGDAAGAVRAFERGVFRQMGTSADILTATSIPAIADTASDLIGTGADLAEPFSPEAAENLRTAEQSVRDAGLGWERGQERLTDPERYYDLRREYLPTPWDPQA